MWPVQKDSIQRLQLELTTYCNAKCPSCERGNYIEYSDDHYKKPLDKIHVDLPTIKKWLHNVELTNIESFHICGNVDEPTLNPNLLDIVEYLHQKYNVYINISTNGGTRNIDFWKQLAKINKVNCIFGIDGLKDTNSIYRRNVRWSKLQSNYRAFISSGGKAIWQFIVFEHNKHQIDEARQLSIDEGFILFQTKYSGRENVDCNPIKKIKPAKTEIRCKATYSSKELEKSFFIDSKGNMWPCCWMATAVNKREFYNKISKQFGGYLSHNLNYNKFDEIIEGDTFSFLNSSFDKMDVCNLMCKQDNTDFDQYEAFDYSTKKALDERTSRFE